MEPSAKLTADQQVDGALDDLATRLGVAPDAIKTLQARSVNWGSSAVGCPREGMQYTQALVPGLLLLLEAKGTVYRYHGAMGQKLFYCPKDRAEAPAFGPGEAVR